MSIKVRNKNSTWSPHN